MLSDYDQIIQGATDGTDIGNVGDSFKTNVTNASGASAVNIQDGGNSITVDGTVTANAGTGNFTVTQATGTNLHTVVDSGTIAATQSGTWNINNVSGTVSLPTGAATSANQTTEITALQLIDNPVGSVTAGTAGTSSYLTGGIFNTSLPTLTNGQQVGTQVDSSGRVIVAPLTNTSAVKAQVQDNAGTGITSTLVSGKQAIDVNVANSFAAGTADKTSFTYGTTISSTIGGVYQDTSPTLVAGTQGAVRLTQNRAIHAAIHDTSGNAITTSSQVGLNMTNVVLEVKQTPVSTSYYSAIFVIDQQAATAANSTVFSMRNAAASTRNVYIERLHFFLNFNAGNPLTRTLQYYLLQRFSGATPTGGTAVTAGKYDSSDPSSQVTDIRYLATGLTTTGVTFDTASLGAAGIGASAAECATYTKEGVSIKLAAGEGFCVRLGNTAVAGQEIIGEIVWSES